jgi:hypothetical protein
MNNVKQDFPNIFQMEKIMCIIFEKNEFLRNFFKS